MPNKAPDSRWKWKVKVTAKRDCLAVKIRTDRYSEIEPDDPDMHPFTYLVRFPEIAEAPEDQEWYKTGKLEIVVANNPATRGIVDLLIGGPRHIHANSGMHDWRAYRANLVHVLSQLWD